MQFWQFIRAGHAQKMLIIKAKDVHTAMIIHQFTNQDQTFNAINFIPRP